LHDQIEFYMARQKSDSLHKKEIGIQTEEFLEVPIVTSRSFFQNIDETDKLDVQQPQERILIKRSKSIDKLEKLKRGKSKRQMKRTNSHATAIAKSFITFSELHTGDQSMKF